MGGKGLTKRLADFKYIAFGECDNGYRVLVRGESGSGSTVSGSAKMRESTSDQQKPPVAAAANRRERRAAARESGDAATRSRSRTELAKGGGDSRGKEKAKAAWRSKADAL